jgi:hypothetical protein
MAWSQDVPKGTRVIYENWINEFERPVKVTYFVLPDGTVDGVHFE